MYLFRSSSSFLPYNFARVGSVHQPISSRSLRVQTPQEGVSVLVVLSLLLEFMFRSFFVQLYITLSNIIFCSFLFVLRPQAAWVRVVFNDHHHHHRHHYDHCDDDVPGHPRYR